MHGMGLYTWKDGRRYQGMYIYDKKHGYGIYQWSDGRRYEGQWSQGKQHGYGAYIQPGTTGQYETKYGLWEMGRRIKWL